MNWFPRTTEHWKRTPKEIKIRALYKTVWFTLFFLGLIQIPKIIGFVLMAIGLFFMFL